MKKYIKFFLEILISLTLGMTGLFAIAIVIRTLWKFLEQNYSSDVQSYFAVLGWIVIVSFILTIAMWAIDRFHYSHKAKEMEEYDKKHPRY